MRDGDWKYLKIRENTFLFDVVRDPLERGNLKERQAEAFARMVADWEEWAAGMLPEDSSSFAESYSAAELADHIGS
jgi:hypothetical protein